jgi:hypothetical protein
MTRFDKTHDKPTTFAQMSQLALDETGGRFAATEARKLIGSSPTNEGIYPKAGVMSDLSGDEPPTGEDINYVIPVTEPHEQIRAAEIAESRLSPEAQDHAHAPAQTRAPDGAPAFVERGSPTNSSKQR